MMDTIDDIFDLLAFLALFGLCVAVAFGLVLPVYYDTVNVLDQSIVDKTSPREEGYVNASKYDGKMSKLEVVLTSQVQESSIPAPRVYKVHDLEIPIGTYYREDLQTLGVAVYNKLHQQDPSGSGRYYFKLNFGDTPSEDDDYYELVKQ